MKSLPSDGKIGSVHFSPTPPSANEPLEERQDASLAASSPGFIRLTSSGFITCLCLLWSTKSKGPQGKREKTPTNKAEPLKVKGGISSNHSKVENLILVSWLLQLVYATLTSEFRTLIQLHKTKFSKHQQSRIVLGPLIESKPQS